MLHLWFVVVISAIHMMQVEHVLIRFVMVIVGMEYRMELKQLLIVEVAIVQHVLRL
jgi:hypothetical protein